MLASTGGGLSLDEDQAFNEGCDARLKGLPPSANPFSVSNASQHRFWLRGWKHVNSYWGADARTGSVKPLRLVEAVQ